MPLFRFHRGTLSESLKTTFHATDKQDLFNKIKSFNKITNKPKTPEDSMCITSSICSPESISIKPYVFDDRIGWDTQIVLVKNECVTKDPYVIGFLSEPFSENGLIEVTK
jgi:hypothetical protein